MVHPYLNRRAGREPVVPLHPSLEPVLARTLGVPLFQEQLLRMAMVAASFTGGQAEELRRAMGFKRSEKRMKQIEVQLREGMARNGITGETAERIITVDHLVRALRVSRIARGELRAARVCQRVSEGALPGGVLHGAPQQPADGVLSPGDARQGRAAPRRPLPSDRRAAVRLAVPRRGRRRHPHRLHVRERLAEGRGAGHGRIRSHEDDGPAAAVRQVRLRRRVDDRSGAPIRQPARGAGVRSRTYFCNICSHEWTVQLDPARPLPSIEQVVQRTGLRRDELTTLADIGALNAFTNERRSALWQVERAVRPAGELFEPGEEKSQASQRHRGPTPTHSPWPERLEAPEPRLQSEVRCAPMDASRASASRLCGHGPDHRPASDGAAARRTGAARRAARRRICRAPRDGRRVRVAGMVITRQRPGTAKGFVFLTLEDETGISNVIIRPDLFDRERMTWCASRSCWSMACCSIRTACCRCAPNASRASGRRRRRRA